MLAPAEAVSHQAVGHLEAKLFLRVDTDDEGERVSDPHVLGYVLGGGVARVNAHGAARHGLRASDLPL